MSDSIGEKVQYVSLGSANHTEFGQYPNDHYDTLNNQHVFTTYKEQGMGSFLIRNSIHKDTYTTPEPDSIALIAIGLTLIGVLLKKNHYITVRP